MANPLLLNKHTREAAEEYADNEAELHGFSRSSQAWKNAFNKSVADQVKTMTLGRNPRRNPRDENTWPEIFGSSGFAGKVASNFHGKGGKPTREEITERIKGAVNTLVYLYLNGIYGMKTTTSVPKSGRISDINDLSDLQLSEKEERASEVRNQDVIMNQLVLTLVESAAYEFLLPFFLMPKSDIDELAEGVKIRSAENKTSIATVKDMAIVRDRTEKNVRERIGNQLKNLSFKDLVRKE